MINSTDLQKIARLLTTAIVLLTLTGCGSGPPKPADPTAAREALERT